MKAAMFMLYKSNAMQHIMETFADGGRPILLLFSLFCVHSSVHITSIVSYMRRYFCILCCCSSSCTKAMLVGQHLRINIYRVCSHIMIVLIYYTKGRQNSKVFQNSSFSYIELNFIDDPSIDRLIKFYAKETLPLFNYLHADYYYYYYHDVS